MAMLNVPVPTEAEDELEVLAEARGSTKSDIAREAIAAFLNAHEFTARGKEPPDDEPDDFAEFGDEVRYANRRVLSNLVEALLGTLIDAEWDKVVEPTYQIFKQRVIKQSVDFGVPRLMHWGADATFLSAPICFAAQDDYNRAVPLDELIYQYGLEEGEEAFAYVRAALALAEKRFAAEEA